MSLIRLAINRQTHSLIDFGGTALSIPDLFQGNVQDFEITVVDPPAGVGQGYTKVDLGSSGLRVAIGPTPTGTAGGPTPLALQNSWTWDATNKRFDGSLSLASASIDSFIGSASSALAYFEVNVTTAGDRKTILQVQVTLKAVVDEQTSTVPSATDTYLTKAESLALFVKFVNDAGATIFFKSPDGTKGRELGVNDDGTGMDDYVAI